MEIQAVPEQKTLTNAIPLIKVANYPFNVPVDLYPLPVAVNQIANYIAKSFTITR